MTTVRALLFDNAAAEAAAAERLAASGFVTGNSPALVCRALLARVAQALDFEVADVLIDAWRTRSALLHAAQETHAQPTLVRQVAIKTYAVPWQHQMEFEVRVAGKTLFTVTADLMLDLEVMALSATVQKGMITAIGGGRYRVAASLGFFAYPLVGRERLFELPFEVKVGKGIPLIT